MLDMAMNNIIEIGEVRNLSETVSDKLQEMIYTGKLKPGERLVQTELAERFQVSRVAIRAALQELRQTGLAVPSDKSGGMIVRPLTRQDIEEIAFVRFAIETEVAVTASMNIDEIGLNKMRNIVKKQVYLRDERNYIGFLNVDWEFHRTFYSYANNNLALSIIEQLWTRANQARGFVLAKQDWSVLWSGQSIETHNEMIKSIATKDTTLLRKTFHKVIEKSKQEQLQWLDQISDSSWIE